MSLISRLTQRPRVFNCLHALHLVNAYSQTHPEERACLCRHIAYAKSAVEIGTFMGLTAAELALVLPAEGILYCVDPYPGGGEPVQQIAKRQVFRAGVSSKVRFVRADSHGALPLLPEQVDFLFVDGDHSYEGLEADWKVVKRLLKLGGIAAFHDVIPVVGSGAFSPGAVRFFDENIANDPCFQIIETVKSLAVLKRVHR